MPVSEAKKRADAKYRAAKRKQIQLDFKTDEFERIKSYCEAKGVKVATWCKEVISKAIENNQ